MKNLSQPVKNLLFSVPTGAALGAVISTFSAGSFWRGWLAAGLLSILAAFLLLQTWHKLGASKSVGVLITVAFILRLAVGIFIYVALPSIGYDTEVQNAGFFYSDAYNRDQTGFQMAVGQGSLFESFKNPENADQYGGLLFLTAVIYRFLSPDAARPLLVTLLGAFAMAAGAAFLYDAVRRRWSDRIALLAAWIYTMFPDSVLLGSSQMREPFLIALACIGFWAVLQWQQRPVRAGVISVISMAVACIFSIPAGCILMAILAAVFLLDWSMTQTDKLKKRLGLGMLALLGIGAVFAGWMWLKDTLYFDAYTTTLASGWITKLMEKFGKKWNIPFVTVYGLTQPVLPAAIFEPSLPIWVTAGILRALAWYMALPLLLYGLFACWKADKKESGWILALLFAVFFLWVVVSSARAGGDQWDNPRYRYILMPFLSLIVAWAVEHYRRTRSPWLWRWVAVIGVFLVFFTYFYATRYVAGNIPALPFLWMIILIAAIDGLILVGSLVFDWIKSKRKAG